MPRRGVNRKRAMKLLRELTDISLVDHEGRPCAVFYPPFPHNATDIIGMTIDLTVRFDPREINRGRGVDDLLNIRKLVRARYETALQELLLQMDIEGRLRWSGPVRSTRTKVRR
jgi:hypothetical protein